MMEVRAFSYRFDAGPFETKEELCGDWNVGNCRRALQWYFLSEKNLFLSPQKILLPEAYYSTGDFIFQAPPVSFERLVSGDIVYAERKNHREAPDTQAYLIGLHTAVYIGEGMLWHATAISKVSCMWPLSTFLEFYEPVAVKRITLSAGS